MMNRLSWERLLDWFQRTPPVQFVVWTVTGIIVWKLSATVVQDILVYGAFLFALTRAFHLRQGFGGQARLRQGFPLRDSPGRSTSAGQVGGQARDVAVWKQPAGIAFVVILIHMTFTLPFAMHPALSLRDFSGMLKIIAGAFAIPVIFNTRAKIEAALFYSATAITCVLGYDLIRLTVFLGPNLLVQAHIFRPFIFNHSNVASMMAGASALVLFYFSWKSRHRIWPSMGCLFGMLLCLVYLVILASRGPQIAFALTCIGAVFLIPGRGIKLLGFLIILLAGLALFVNIEHVNPRFLEKRSMTNFSERDKVWTHTWDLARQRPWLGYGYGKRNFEVVYYSTQPPKSVFHYPHPHQFWLKLLFEFGWPGLILHLMAWLILALSLWRCVFAQPTFTDRLLPGTVGLIFCFIHLYGLGDYPDNIVLMAQFWLIPVALVLMKKTDDEHAT